MVCDLKLYIKAQNSAKIKCDTGDLKLYSATTRDTCVQALEEGNYHKEVQDFLDGKPMMSVWTVQAWLLKQRRLRKGKVHLLVKLPEQTPLLHSFQLFPDVQKPHHSRDQLVDKPPRVVHDTNVVLMLSPARSGNTSQLNLFALRCPTIRCVPIPLSNVSSSASELLAQYGVDVMSLTYSVPYNNGLVVFMLDDALCKYDDF